MHAAKYQTQGRGHTPAAAHCSSVNAYLVTKSDSVLALLHLADACAPMRRTPHSARPAIKNMWCTLACGTSLLAAC